jgi:hypothetical protein
MVDLGFVYLVPPVSGLQSSFLEVSPIGLRETQERRGLHRDQGKDTHGRASNVPWGLLAFLQNHQSGDQSSGFLNWQHPNNIDNLKRKQTLDRPLDLRRIGEPGRSPCSP